MCKLIFSNLFFLSKLYFLFCMSICMSCIVCVRGNVFCYMIYVSVLWITLCVYILCCASWFCVCWEDLYVCMCMDDSVSLFQEKHYYKLFENFIKQFKWIKKLNKEKKKKAMNLQFNLLTIVLWIVEFCIFMNFLVIFVLDSFWNLFIITGAFSEWTFAITGSYLILKTIKLS